MHRSSRHLAGALAALGCVTLSAACASQPQQEPREVAITSMSPEVMDELAERIAARVAVPAPAIAVAPARRAPVVRRPVQPRVFAAPVPRVEPPPVEPLSDERLATVSESVSRGLDWLARHQSENGAWDAAGFAANCDKGRCDQVGNAHYTPGVTGLALLCFLEDGSTAEEGRHKDVVRRGLAYLIGIQDAEGCLGTRATQHFQYNHAAASLALVEAYRKSGDERLGVAAQEAVNFIQMARNPYLAWRYGVRDGDNDTSVTGWMVHVLASARAADLQVDPGAFQGALTWVEKMTEPEFGRVGYQQRGGSPARMMEMMDRFPSDRTESLTAEGVLTRLHAGQVADSTSAIQKGADLIYAKLPVWAPGSGSIDLYYWFWGTNALSRLGGTRWNGWSHAVTGALLAGQEAGEQAGSFGSWPALGPWGTEGGRVYATAMATLSLEAVRSRGSGD